MESGALSLLFGCPSLQAAKGAQWQKANNSKDPALLTGRSPSSKPALALRRCPDMPGMPFAQRDSRAPLQLQVHPLLAPIASLSHSFCQGTATHTGPSDLFCPQHHLGHLPQCSFWSLQITSDFPSKMLNCIEITSDFALTNRNNSQSCDCVLFITINSLFLIFQLSTTISLLVDILTFCITLSFHPTGFQYLFYIPISDVHHSFTFLPHYPVFFFSL